MKACLAGGDPIIIGFSVYQSFESQQVASTGHVPMPNPSSEIAARRTLRDGGRIRRRQSVVHLPQFVGHRLGNGWIFYDALPVSTRPESVGRFLDNQNRQLRS